MPDELELIEQPRRTPASIVLAFHSCEISLYQARFEMLYNDPGAFDRNDDLLFTKERAV